MGTIGAIGIKERRHKPARRGPSALGKPELYFLDEIGKLTVKMKASYKDEVLKIEIAKGESKTKQLQINVS